MNIPEQVTGALSTIKGATVSSFDRFSQFMSADSVDGGSGTAETKSEAGVNPDIESRSKSTGNYPTVFETGQDSLYYRDKNKATTYTREESEGKPKLEVQQSGDFPYSVFNKYSLMDSINLAGGGKSTHNKISAAELENPTATKIIEQTGAYSGNLGYRYNYADFALAKYFNKIPNNRMLTLRRFPFPAPDDIISPIELDKDGKPQPMSSPDIARAITWMGEKSGNNLADILKFSHGYNWKDVEAEVQTLQSQNSGRRGNLGGLIDDNRFLTTAVGAAEGKNAYDIATGKANAGHDSFSGTYPNHVFGPLNVIKNILQREQGLTFTQEFTIKFEYELRSIGGANPKVLMMDQLANMLVLTYSTAPFWGGSTRWIGDGSVGKPLGDISKLASGDISGFLGGIYDDLKGMTGGGGFKEIGSNLLEGGGKALKNMIGGSLMEMMNSPQGGQTVAAMLSGDPTGQWHLTVGNPLNPMAVIGNLACTGTSVTFDGPLGIQDFPEKMIVEVTLKPGRPRDKSDIEAMFNMGRGRFYIEPEDGVDVNATVNVDSYGRETGSKSIMKEFRKITNG